jgi:superfamily II DNA or RNA helicase
MDALNENYIIKGVLVNYGMTIKKKAYSVNAIQCLRTWFNVKPILTFNEDDPNNVNDTFDVYFEDDNYIVIPKFFAFSTIDIQFFDEITQKIHNGITLSVSKVNYKHEINNFSFNGKLRDYQMQIIDCILEKFKNEKSLNHPCGGIIKLSTGAGKTVLAIYLAHVLKLKTLIIVHQEFLQDQWIDRFKKFTDAKIGTIRGSVIDIENKDIVVGMVQSISSKDYEDHVFQGFGLVIYDEVHHYGSRVFSRALMKTSSQYSIGLSATPERNDGLIKIINWFVGPILFEMDRQYSYKVLVKKIFFSSDNPLFKEQLKYILGKRRQDHIGMTDNIMKIDSRNKLMILMINSLKSMGRTIFVISSRVEHLKILKTGVDFLIKEAGESHIYNTYYYIGPTKKGEKRMAEKDGNIIFATIQLASEALDIPRLDTIILALPIKQDKTLIQSIGRILRNDTLESLTQIPLVIDISDMFSIYKKWSEKRENVYETKKWFLQYYYWYDEKYQYRGKEDKNKNPMNVMFDNIIDEDFIENNLIIKNDNVV